MDVKTARLAQKLSVLLEQEASILARLLELLGEEKRALSAADMREMPSIAKQKELLVIQHSYLENERGDLCKRLGQRLGLVAGQGGWRLLEIAECLGGALGDALKAMHQRLKTLVESLQTLGALNNRVMSFMMEAVRSSIAFLERHPAVDTVYTADGARMSAVSTRMSMVNVG